MKKQPTPIKARNCYAAALSALIFTTVLLFTAISASAGAHRAGKVLAKVEKRSNGAGSGSPTISYSGGVHTYAGGIAITPLAPTSSGVADFGTWGSPTILDGKKCAAVTIDNVGNIYYTKFNGYTDSIKKIPAGGGVPVTIFHDVTDPLTGITTDAAGNLWVADPVGNVYEINPTTGATISLTFYYSPSDVVIDRAGNQIVADQHWGVIKGTDTIPLKIPYALALDANQNLYVSGDGANYNSPYIYKFNSALMDSVLLTSSILHPVGLAIDKANNVYVADGGTTNNIKTINGDVLFSPDMAVAGVAIDSVGNLIISGDKLIKTAPTGGYFINPSLPAGLSFNDTTGTISGTPTAASPETTYTITAYNSSGSASAKVRIKTTAAPLPPPTISYSSPHTYALGAAITPLAPTSSGVASAANLSYEGGIGINSALSFPNAITADRKGSFYAVVGTQLLRVPPNSSTTNVIYNFSGIVNNIAADTDGNIYACMTNKILEISPAGSLLNTIPLTFTPGSTTIANSGNIYTHDGNNLYKITAGGSTVVNLAAISAIFGLAVDGNENIYIANNITKTIKMLPAAGGPMVTIAGGFPNIYSVAIEPGGNIFADYGTGAEIIPAGGGSPIALDTLDYSFGETSSGLCIDGQGNVYLNFGTISKVQPVNNYHLSQFLPAGLTFNDQTGIISGTPINVSPPR